MTSLRQCLAPAAAAICLAASPALSANLRVTSTADAGPGTLRHAIRIANEAPGSTITIAIPAAEMLLVEQALPAITGRGTRLDGGGATLREARGCMRPRGKIGCDGLVISGPGVTIRNVRVAGFTFDGIAVRGADARDVTIDSVDAIDNLDDGVGVSAAAGPVTVTRSLLMGNGYRTKGKGLLVFDGAHATLRDSVVVANRDGITVTRDGRATLANVVVAGNFDKGIGIGGGRVDGSRTSIVANGRDPERRAPNGDGLRVGLGGIAELSDCRIAGNGDGGVVVLERSTATLRRCRIEANGGAPRSVAAGAKLSER
jgi:hypothetical protein